MAQDPFNSPLQDIEQELQYEDSKECIVDFEEHYISGTIENMDHAYHTFSPVDEIKTEIIGSNEYVQKSEIVCDASEKSCNSLSGTIENMDHAYHTLSSVDKIKTEITESNKYLQKSEIVCDASEKSCNSLSGTIENMDHAYHTLSSVDKIKTEITESNKYLQKSEIVCDASEKSCNCFKNEEKCDIEDFENTSLIKQEEVEIKDEVEQESTDTDHEPMVKRPKKSKGQTKEVEYKTRATFSASKTNQNSKQIIDLLDDFDRNVIRRKVHQYFFRNEIPTNEKVLKEVNDDPALPNFNRSTFDQLLKSLNFKYEKHGRCRMLVDKVEIVKWRREYLEKMNSYRNEKRKVYFLDETWVSADANSVSTSKQAFLDGISRGRENPSGKGNRLMACHIGSEDGFVPDALWLLEFKKSKRCNEELDAPSFEKWFENTLPKLDDNSVIVLDNTPYHSRRLEKIPTFASPKCDIQEWLRSKNIDFEESSLKLELLQIVKQHKQKYQKYIIDEMAKAHNKTVLRIPPYHGELNPIELIWADIKKIVAESNTTCKMDDVKDILCTAVANFSAEKWKECFQYVRQKVEKDLWELDDIIEQRLESLAFDGIDDDEDELLHKLSW